MQARRSWRPRECQAFDKSTHCRLDGGGEKGKTQAIREIGSSSAVWNVSQIGLCSERASFWFSSSFNHRL